MKKIILGCIFLTVISCSLEDEAYFENILLTNEIDDFIDSAQNVGMNNDCEYILMYWKPFMNKHSISLHMSKPFCFEDLYCIINYKDYKIFVYSDYDLSEHIYLSNSYKIDTSTIVKATKFEINNPIDWYSSGFYYDGNKIYNPYSVTRDALYPEGDVAFVNLLGEKIKYPPKAIANEIEGEVLVTFDIDKKGRILNVKLLRGIDSECDQVVLQAINEISTLNPKTIFNKPVETMSYISVNFVLDSLDLKIKSGLFSNTSNELSE